MGFSVVPIYSKVLGHMGRYKEMLEIVREGELLSLKHGDLVLLPSFTANHAWALSEMGKKEESVPYFAMVHYGLALLGNIENQQALANYMKEHLEVAFD